jgi:hypothetical protein
VPDLFESQVETSDFALPGDEELLGRTEQATTETETPTTAAEEPTQETPRDEQGRFTAREEETPSTPDPEDAAAPTGGESDDELQAYLAKYGGDQDKALRAALEAQKLIGRKQSEIDELKSSLEERFDQFEERLAPAAPNVDLQTIADRLVDRPDLIPQVAQAAFQEGNRDILKVAMVAWGDHDPYAAEDFRRRWRERPRAEIYRADTAASEIEDGWNQSAQEFAKTHPDFNVYAAKMNEIAPEYPHILKILEHGAPKAQLEVLDFLYVKAQRLQGDTAAAQAREAEAATAADTDRAIEEAAVTSGTTTHSEQKLSPAEVIGQQWEAKRKMYDDGWNV